MEEGQTPPEQPVQEQPHRATLIVVLGILALVGCLPLGIAAWIMGNRDLARVRAGTMDPSGASTTNVGVILGIVGVCLGAVMLIASLLLVPAWYFIYAKPLPASPPM